MAEDVIVEIKNQSTFHYIEGLMNQARKGRVVERTTRVQIKRSDPLEWKQKAFIELKEWLAESKDHAKTIDLWAAVYVRCGRCARGFRAWYESCEIGPEDDLESWIKAAIETIEKNRWI
jgi:hypothetical protein